MNSLIKAVSVAVILSASLAISSYAQAKAMVEMGITSNMSLTLDRHPDNSIKTRMTAESVQHGAVMQMNVVKVEVLTPAGEVETVIEAETCNLDKADKLAQSDGPITLTHPDLTLTGTGFRWSAQEERIEVLSKVRVVLKKGVNTPLLGR